ncbi:MAG: AbrB/MazE/SpoVT family DNA-binding domain-containing protein [Candidatus Woesebacteria bacterium]|nr:AbrB/MazE/SpoVT family DNA-binding domain-containing protein [Candidatus Woesebacteria bacterium]
MQILTTTVTQKGQVTLPKMMRDMLNILPNSKVVVSLAKESIKIKPVGPDILDLAGTFKIPKGAPGVLEAREFMEKNYSRF